MAITTAITSQNAVLAHPRANNPQPDIKVAAQLDCAETLHLWVQVEAAGNQNAMVVKEFVPSWLRNSLAFDVDAFTGRLEDFRAQARTACEAIWPGHKVHAAYDVELIAHGMRSIAEAGHDPDTRAVKAERQRDQLLAALKELLEHEGTVACTGIGEMPSEELENARSQAQIAIREVEPA
jgi:hypothetical protein